MGGSSSFAKYNPVGTTVRSMIVPGEYGLIPNHHKPASDVKVIHLTSQLGDRVDSRFYTAHNDQLLIGFHGNGCTIDAMDSTWREFSQLANVLAVNMPGYGRTTVAPNGANLEVHMAANIRAVIQWATKEKGYIASDITFYGLSLGGSQAAIGFSMLPGSHLILHNTFESSAKVIKHILGQSVGARLAHPLSSLLSWSAFPLGMRESDGYVTDRLDTFAKLRKSSRTRHDTESRLLVIAADSDEIMSPDFPYNLAQAYYGDDLPPDCVHIMKNATHNSSLVNNQTAWGKVVKFMLK